jgi:hypothetical protein
MTLLRARVKLAIGAACAVGLAAVVGISWLVGHAGPATYELARH